MFAISAECKAFVNELAENVTTQSGWLEHVKRELTIAETCLTSSLADPNEVLEHYVAAALMAQHMQDYRVALIVAHKHGVAAMTLARYADAVRVFRFAAEASEAIGDEEMESEMRVLLREAENSVDEMSNNSVQIASPVYGKSDICAICLRSEIDLGKALPWVLPGCGHKCLCKTCLRKLRAHNRTAFVECPICRTRSKPTLSANWTGQIFTVGENT